MVEKKEAKKEAKKAEVVDRRGDMSRRWICRRGAGKIIRYVN